MSGLSYWRYVDVTNRTEIAPATVKVALLVFDNGRQALVEAWSNGELTVSLRDDKTQGWSERANGKLTAI